MRRTITPNSTLPRLIFRHPRLKEILLFVEIDEFGHPRLWVGSTGVEHFQADLPRTAVGDEAQVFLEHGGASNGVRSCNVAFAQNAALQGPGFATCNPANASNGVRSYNVAFAQNAALQDPGFASCNPGVNGGRQCAARALRTTQCTVRAARGSPARGPAALRQHRA